MRAGTDESNPIFQLARRVGSVAASWHRARLQGLENLPSGPALLVGNHGLFGWETLVFFYLLHRDAGRVPVGLADKRVFGAPPIRELLEVVGGIPGTRDNAHAALEAGRWVVCYPGGSREVFKSPEGHYRLAWDRALGFARIAIDAKVPIVPFAGLGVDDTFLNLGHLSLAKRVLGRYGPPLALGLGPVPLPVELTFRFAPAIDPGLARGRPEVLKRYVQTSVEALLENHREPSEQPIAAVS